MISPEQFPPLPHQQSFQDFTAPSGHPAYATSASNPKVVMNVFPSESSTHSVSNYAVIRSNSDSYSQFSPIQSAPAIPPVTPDNRSAISQPQKHQSYGVSTSTHTDNDPKDTIRYMRQIIRDQISKHIVHLNAEWDKKLQAALDKYDAQLRLTLTNQFHQY